MSNSCRKYDESKGETWVTQYIDSPHQEEGRVDGWVDKTHGRLGESLFYSSSNSLLLYPRVETKNMQYMVVKVG